MVLILCDSTFVTISARKIPPQKTNTKKQQPKARSVRKIPAPQNSNQLNSKTKHTNAQSKYNKEIYKIKSMIIN